MGNLAINPKQQFFFSGQINELNNHAVEATVSILGLKNPAIRQHLVRELKGEKHLNSNKDALMGDPVFDVLFPWEEQPLKTTQLTSLLHLETIATITGAKEVTEEDKKTAITIPTPYKHQLESWQLLNDDSITNSLVVTSGTGSGKTECFMVPILDDLIRQHHETKQRLNGVQALFLYPLNALINSQQERLNKWTRHFDTNIQFCLYNGNTDEKPKQKHNDNKNQIQSRELLRQTPPPILVTNATMLEYMLIRQLDKSIIDKSKGKLKWIVLDEAHSYLGSTASELSLLLKRVMLAFEVEPKNVHFIATSATIGDDEKAKQQLKSFLASLSGTHEQQIHIITAQRAVPPITLSNDSINETTPTLQKIVNIDPAQEVSKLRYQALANHSFAMQLRDKFVKDEIGNKLTQPRDLQTLLQVLSPALTKMMAVEKQLNPRFELSPADYLLKWLDVCSYTKPNDEDAAFLPLRAHVFQRTLAGLYACVNPSCSGKPEILKQSNIHGQAEWEFGYLYTSARHQCDYCDFPVFEVAFCQECQTPHLLAQEDSHNSNKKLAPLSREQPDEFTLNTDIDDNETLLDEQSDDDTSTKLQVLMPVQSSKQQSSISKDDTASNCLYQLQHISPFGEYFTFPKDETVEISIKDIGEDNQKKLKYCYFCDTSSQLKDIIKPIYLGAPFYMSESINTLLDYCKPFEKESDSLPYQGKRMITFTDSRQGTARITMKLRQDSERRTLRHIVYHELAKQINSESSKQKLQEIKEAEEAIQQLIDMNMNQVAIDLLIKQKKQLEKSIANPVMSWSDMTSAIVNHPEFRFLKASIKKVAKIHDIESEKELAELLLLNELARRPRNANSLETLGLVYITYPILDDEIKKIDGFKEWQDLGFDLQDWKDFLKLLLDFYIREEKFVNLSFNQIQSINEKFFGKLELLPPNSEKDFHENDKKYIRTWLKTYASSPNRSRRLVKLLALPKDLNLNDKICQDKINAILVQAWKALTEQTKLLTQTTNLGQKTFQLDFKNVSLTIPQKVYICPITNRFLDTTLKGYTPYLPNKQNLPEILRHKEDYQCKSVQIPVFQGDVMESNHTEEAKNWLKNEPVLLELRNQNLWTDISDSVVAGMNTLVTEEHSAQINQEALKYYENSFKEGKTNILNCSTTMEMGVDIGGISTVAMNNVPPHPANYLQRTGRAGRRKESHAIAYTICKNNPHEQMVFHNTKWAFDTKINPPSITLNSEQILQRHINAYLLGLFLNEQHQHDSSNITLKSGWFFLNWSEESLKRENREALINNILERALKNTDNELSETNSTDKNILTKEMLEAIFLSKTPYCKMQEWLDTLIHQDTTIDSKLKITKGIERIICQSNVANHHPNTFLQKALEGLKKQKRFIVDKIVNKLLEYHSIRSGKNKNSAYLVKLMIDITGIASTYLLSDLARFGFLPRYGFPAGIVEFDIYNSSYYAQQKKKKRNTPKPKKSEAREDNLSFANGKPMRDLAVALREYLTDPETQDYLADTEENKTLLLTLAVVLRDELAKCHGISEDELGCGIKPLSIEGKTIQAIFIYDKASGGAGFASTANKYIIKMLINAKKALECKDDCEKACHSCLLTFDTRFIADKLNRHLALDYINKIQSYLQLPNEADLLNNTEYCSSSISERIAEGFQQGFDTITLYLQGNPEQWALTSALHTRIKLWTFNNKNVELVINQTYFDKLLEVDKDYLLSLSKLPDVHLYCWQSDRQYLDNHYLVQLSKSNPSDHKVLTLATTDKNAYIPNNSLWQVELGAYTVEDSTCQKMMVESLPERFYQQQSDKNAKVIDITIQLDGTIKELGSKFWELLDKEKPDGLGQYLKNKVEIKSISYEDSYVSSPFVVLIIGEFLHSLKSLYGNDWSNPRVTVKTSGVSETNKGHKTELGLQLKHNWKDDTTQEKVIERYLKNLGLEASCYINSFKSVSHHRPLTITWDNGNKTTIYLDHGVGFIDYADNNQRRLIEFDFKQNVDEQVKQILRISESALNLKNASNLAIVTVRE